MAADPLQKFMSHPVYGNFENFNAFLDCGDMQAQDKQEIVHHWQQYETDFNPSKYMNMYYSKINSRPQMGGTFTDKNLHQIFEKIPPKTGFGNKPRRLLEIGSGPSLLLSIFAESKFDEIYLSDYSSANRNELVSALNGTDDFDWSARLEYIRQCGFPIDENIMSRLQSKVKNVMYCNVRDPSVLEMPIDQVDAVAVLLCLEAASETLEEYKKASKNVISLLKPAGHFVQSGMINQRQYESGSGIFTTVSTTKKQVQDTLVQNGIEILEWYERPEILSSAEEDSDDVISYYICYGVKMPVVDTEL